MIKVVSSSTELTELRNSFKESVGFVPTMGNLHEGHISLLTKALEENDTVFFSIFVNPKQFGPNEDFGRYPRTFEADLEKITSCVNTFQNKNVVVFHPANPTEVFPKNESLHIEVTPINNDLEGALRPGHFDGVATVVYKLFRLVRPFKAYFGLKDFQQYLVIKRMVKDLKLPIQIIGMPIKRDESGLALSSRNQYLDEKQKAAALILSQTLLKIKTTLNGSRNNLPQVQSLIAELLKDKSWNYIELRDSETFSTNIMSSKNITALMVYQLGSTRLLDNMQMEIQ